MCQVTQGRGGRMRRGCACDDHNLGDKERFTLDVASLGSPGMGSDDDVVPPLAERLQRIAKHVAGDRNVDVWKDAPKPGNGTRQYFHGSQGRRADANHARIRAAKRRDLVIQMGQICLNGPHARQNRHASIGRNDTPRRSEKQRQPGFLFDLTDLLSERGLCLAQHLRGRTN